MQHLTAEYENIIPYLKSKGFEVKTHYFDSLGNDGDDGGFAIIISEKNDKTYLHILGVCQFAELRNYCLDETDEQHNNRLDYIVCQDEEVAGIYIREFVSALRDMKIISKYDSLVDNNEYNLWNGWNEPEIFEAILNNPKFVVFRDTLLFRETGAKQLSHFISMCFAPFIWAMDENMTNIKITFKIKRYF